VAKWLFKLGAAEDIRTKDICDRTPMYTACSEGELHCVTAVWLIRHGNQGQERPREPQRTLQRRLFSCSRTVRLWTTQTSSTSLYQPFASASQRRLSPPATKLLRSGAPSPLALMQGRKLTAFFMIADFLQVVWGRPLRSAREAYRRSTWRSHLGPKFSPVTTTIPMTTMLMTIVTVKNNYTPGSDEHGPRF